MTGPTHRVYSVLFAFLTTMLFYKHGVTTIGYYQTLLIVLTFSKSGALFPDLDHNWHNIGVKTVPNKIINTLIHITGGKHRSWQTHSIDICIIFTVLSYIIPNKLYEMNKITIANKEVTVLILLGFASGWISHLFSDMLTNAGVRLFCFINYKIALVPKKIGNLRFNTGNEWEAFNYKAISVTNKIVGFISLIYPFIGNIKEIIYRLLG